jgi:hypothetical protein
MVCHSPALTGNMALVRTPQVPVAQPLGSHNLLPEPPLARLRPVRMLALLARLHRVNGRGVTRVHITQIIGVVGVLQVSLLSVRADGQRCVHIGYYPQQTAAGQQGATDVQQGH